MSGSRLVALLAVIAVALGAVACGPRTAPAGSRPLVGLASPSVSVTGSNSTPATEASTTPPASATPTVPPSSTAVRPPTPSPGSSSAPAQPSTQQQTTRGPTTSSSATKPPETSNRPSTPATTKKQAGPVPPQGGSCPPSAPIKGNINKSRGTKIYHVPGSRYYDQTKAEVCFATTAEAVANGYRAPKN